MLIFFQILLGGTVSRKKKGCTYQIQAPGADHHARWMSKVIYIIKMSLLSHQLPSIHHSTKKNIHKMALFSAFVYMRAWFRAPLLASAASNDIELYRYCYSVIVYYNICLAHPFNVYKLEHYDYVEIEK